MIDYGLAFGIYQLGISHVYVRYLQRAFEDPEMLWVEI